MSGRRTVGTTPDGSQAGDTNSSEQIDSMRSEISSLIQQMGQLVQLVGGLAAHDESSVDKPVREAIGCLMWLLFTRPDIALPLNKLQKIAHSPTERKWNALVRILSYLNETKDLGITYVRGSGLDLDVFVDSSYADSTVDRRSTTGLAVTVGGTVVCASTKTQPVTAQSTTEAEYIAAGEGVKEALFVRGVLSFIAPETSGATIRVREDNEGALALVQNPFSSARSKHIDVRFHFIRELFKAGKITADYVSTEE
ncbi:unnamed protein product [Ectocarpus sp. CCAP 1310/34]|nr:unnamed protein product [Ectocarpus sp. CCAP 1310/34]